VRLQKAKLDYLVSGCGIFSSSRGTGAEECPVRLQSRQPFPRIGPENAIAVSPVNSHSLPLDQVRQLVGIDRMVADQTDLARLRSNRLPDHLAAHDKLCRRG
jgi:hypothetical protein